jgi:beta-N-acetylhexosaminidase
MKSYSIERKVGQLLIVGVPGLALDRGKLDYLARIGVGGVVLFGHNYESVPQLIELTNSIQKTLMPESLEGLPAWICVDHEGGRVQRFKDPFTVFPPAQQLGDLNSPKTTFEAGYVMAKELRSVGVNVNFAPVIDLTGPVVSKAIKDRAFSSNPDVVASLGSAAVRGLLKGGVFAVAKHFPGHGAVEEDTHETLPTCHKSMDELEKSDWIPFRRVFRSRVEGLMTCHILYPKIDPDRPATLSRKILGEILRKSMRYSKIIFSDDLEMAALQKKYSLMDAAFLSFEAGCEQLLLCHEWSQIEQVHAYLVKAFQSGALPVKRLDEAVEKVVDAKKRFLLPFHFADKDLARAIVGAPDFQEVAKAIREKRVLEKGPSNAVDNEG